MAKSQFSELFEHYDDLYAALKAVVERGYEKSGSVDPAEVVRELLAAKPDISLSPAELLAEVCASGWGRASSHHGQVDRLALPPSRSERRRRREMPDTP